MNKPYELTDEKLDELLEVGVNQDDKGLIQNTWEEAQKKLLEYLMGTCPHSRGDFRDKEEPVTQCFRHACGECMQTLLKDFGVD